MRCCGVPVLCGIRIAASPVQVGRPPREGSHSLEDAISERKVIPWAGLFQRGIGPGEPRLPDRPDGAARSDGAEDPAPGCAKEPVCPGNKAAPRLTLGRDPQAGPETQLNSGRRPKSETQLRAKAPCRVGERRGLQCKSASRGTKTGPGTKAKLDNPDRGKERGRIGTRRQAG